MKRIHCEPSRMKSIQGTSMLRPNQGMSRSDIRMAQDDSQTFDPVQLRLHVERERLVFRPVFSQVPMFSAPLQVFERIGKETSSGVPRLCGDIDFMVEETSNPNVGIAWGLLQKATGLHLVFGQPLSAKFLATAKRITMAPRFRATPRRGRHHGQRGGATGRGTHSPRRVSPLACASPSSNRSEDSGQSISNTVQSARFHYRRRTNKPFISALITVIFEEEDAEEGPSEEQSPLNSNKSSPSQGRKDSSYSPSSQSKLVDESSPAPTEEQTEVLAEIGSLQDPKGPELAQEQAMISQERADSKPTSTQHQGPHKMPDFYYANTLYPKLPPGMKLEDVPEGMEISWEPLDEFNVQSSENVK